MNDFIVVVDDETDIVDLVILHLERAGFNAKGYPDAGSFLGSLSERVPDLVVLDLMLPDADGFDICKKLKRNENYASIPIIMLTARGEETEKVLGLELGADDYVTKPFSPRELVARVKVVLRRRESQPEVERVNIGGILDLDLNTYVVTVEGRPVDLTSTEFKILRLLASKKGWAFSRGQILEHLWGQDKIVLDRTVDVHIRNLRQKLGKASVFIKNLPGIGYKLEE